MKTGICWRFLLLKLRWPIQWKLVWPQHAVWLERCSHADAHAHALAHTHMHMHTHAYAPTRAQTRTHTNTHVRAHACAPVYASRGQSVVNSVWHVGGGGSAWNNSFFRHPYGVQTLRDAIRHTLKHLVRQRSDACDDRPYLTPPLPLDFTLFDAFYMGPTISYTICCPYLAPTLPLDIALFDAFYMGQAIS